MNEAVRTAALRTTARLVLSFGIVGCASSPDGVPEPSQGNAAAAAPEAETIHTARFTDWGGGPAEPQGPKAERTACCISVLGDESHAAHTEACDKLASEGFGVPGRWECCDLLQDEGIQPTGTLACTPWGPPVPPSFEVA